MQKSMDSTDCQKLRFVVGVDFGMTVTSVAFGHSLFSNDIRLVQSWPNTRSQDSCADKVPSLVHYTNPKTRDKKWGFEVNPGSPGVLGWFKLLLQHQTMSTLLQKPDTHMRDGRRTASVHLLESLFNGLSLSGNASNFPAITAPPVPETVQTLQKLQISPVSVASDFLKSVLESTMTNMEATFGGQCISSSKVAYVLTVPATWSDSAKAQLVKAAEDAGFGLHQENFSLMSKPECAATYTLNIMQPKNFKIGNTFIVCNAGTWTVDINSYKIIKMEPLILDEIACATGALCGSVFLDQAFEGYIRGVLGNIAINSMKPRSKSRMMRSWEKEVKFIFPNKEEEYVYEVAVPGIRDNEEVKVEDGYHTMQSNVVQKIFDPIMDKIIDLVEHQVIGLRQMGEPVAVILLVGELGSSEYLRKRLQNTQFGWRLTSLQVLQPRDCRTAVVRGAVLRGLDGSNKKYRRAPRSIGGVSSIGAPEDWKSKKNTWRSDYDSICEHMEWDQVANSWSVRGYMNWYIAKGMAMSEKESVSINLSKKVSYTALPKDFIIVTPLYACDLPDPPEFDWKNPSAIYTLCTIRSDLSSIPLSKWTQITNADGERFHELKCTLRLTILDEGLKFDSIVGGSIIGEVIARH